MSVELLTAAFKDTTTTGATRLVLLALSNISDHAGRSWPSVPYLAGASRLADRSVRRALGELESLGWLEILPRYRDNGSQASNEYLLHPPDEVSPPPDTVSAPPCQEVQGDPDEVSPPYTEVVSMNGGGNDPSGDTTTRAREEENGFEEWWKVYPRKVGKIKAEKIWRRLRKSGELPPTEEVVAATEAQCRSSRWCDDPRFIPHPTTWLERGSWADKDLEVRRAMGYDGEQRWVVDTP